MRKVLTIALSLFALFAAAQGPAPVPAETSVAGFFPLEGSGRMVWNFNNGWLFRLGDVADAWRPELDDTEWEEVSTPHSVQLTPAEASGCRNYQGVAWYRKHFVMPMEAVGRDVTLHFEAVMGRQRFYVNGQLVREHEGGYLPVTISLTEAGVQPGQEAVVAVMTDNSDDKSYPPGKTQYTLDFAYHGGIYRDVWLIAKSLVAITDAVEQGDVAGGGVFVHFEGVSQERADVVVATQVRNGTGQGRYITVTNSLEGVARQSRTVYIEARETKTVTQRLRVAKPRLWSPESPALYRLATQLREHGRNLDGGITRVGIRSFEFVGRYGFSTSPSTKGAAQREPGFYLNGKKYHQLVGANRHQDFAYVGNALPNSQQWRDAKRLRDAGFTIIRTAHYPQDPSFMDACDELGLFVIVATPGWQFWNKAEGWDQKVHQNTRLIIRRDRNHPSVLMWEPILNETRFPESFALEALQVTREEYPFSGRPVAAADVHSAGVRDNYDVVYGWPGDDFADDAPRQCIFTREFGEYVDDWYAHNNINRASRSWGERPQLVQAMSLAQTTASLYRTTGQYFGGCLWHPFDHQRGYHPDPYWGGIYDAFRQPKYALPMFQAALLPPSESPMVFVAHEMTQFSDSDITVFSNCDSVRLTLYDTAHVYTLPVNRPQPLVFRGAWDFWEARKYSYTQKAWQKVRIVAEGIVNGEVVCREERMPSRRSTRLRLVADENGHPLVADGSDFIVVVCEVTDDLGHVRRLAKESIRFSVSGEGEIIGDEQIGANPREVEWGSAPVLVRSTRQAGAITVRAEVTFPGTHAPQAAELVIHSVPAAFPSVYSSRSGSQAQVRQQGELPQSAPATTLTDEEKARLLQEVEQQQADFGVK